MSENKINIKLEDLLQAMLSGEVSASFSEKVLRLKNKYIQWKIMLDQYSEEMKFIYLKWLARKTKKEMSRMKAVCDAIALSRRMKRYEEIEGAS